MYTCIIINENDENCYFDVSKIYHEISVQAQELVEFNTAAAAASELKS